jgi:hypothetical protein
VNSKYVFKLKFPGTSNSSTPKAIGAISLF